MSAGVHRPNHTLAETVGRVFWKGDARWAVRGNHVVNINLKIRESALRYVVCRLFFPTLRSLWGQSIQKPE